MTLVPVTGEIQPSKTHCSTDLGLLSSCSNLAIMWLPGPKQKASWSLPDLYTRRSLSSVYIVIRKAGTIIRCLCLLSGEYGCRWQPASSPLLQLHTLQPHSETSLPSHMWTGQMFYNVWWFPTEHVCYAKLWGMKKNQRHLFTQRWMLYYTAQINKSKKISTLLHL